MTDEVVEPYVNDLDATAVLISKTRTCARSTASSGLLLLPPAPDTSLEGAIVTDSGSVRRGLRVFRVAQRGGFS